MSADTLELDRSRVAATVVSSPKSSWLLALLLITRRSAVSAALRTASVVVLLVPRMSPAAAHGPEPTWMVVAVTSERNFPEGASLATVTTLSLTDPWSRHKPLPQSRCFYRAKRVCVGIVGRGPAGTGGLGGALGGALASSSHASDIGGSSPSRRLIASSAIRSVSNLQAC
jgi:hypothetical protein